MECRVIRSGRGTVLWERLKLYRRLFFSVEDDLADADFVIAASSDEVLNAKSPIIADRRRSRSM